MSLAKAAESLVVRARQGDQNAMGLLAMVGQQARAGQSRAKLTQRLVEMYVKEHPVRGSSFLGEPLALTFPRECLTDLLMPETWFSALQRLACTKLGFLIACVTLANGPTMSVQRFKAYASSVPQNADMVAVANTLREALRLQIVRDPRVPLRVFSPRVAWELA